MKNTTVYTKPLRMTDGMPTRISDVLTLTEEDGQVNMNVLKKNK